MLNAVSCANAQWGQTNLRFWSRERLIAGPSKESRWLMLRKPELPDGFQRSVFMGKIWGEGCRVCDFLPDWLVVLTGQCSRNPVFSLKLLSSTWVPAEELTDTIMYIPWGGTSILFYNCCTIVSWLLLLCFCISLLLWLETVWICSLGLMEVSEAEAFFLQTRNGRHGKGFVPRRAPQGPAQFQKLA